MAEVSLPLSRSRAEPLPAAVRERFLSPSRLAAVAVFVLFAATFDTVFVQDDGLVYYDFVRKVFGLPADAVAYQFGSAVWTAPFYLVSRLVAVRGQLGAYHAGEVATAVASNAAAVGCLYFGWRILRELELPRGGAVLLLTLFGTPLYYVASLSPSGKHAADTLYATAAFFFVLRATKRDARRLDLAALGVCLGLLVVTRYANAALAAGIVAVFAALRDTRALRWLLATGAATAVVLLLVPVLRHIPYAQPPSQTLALGNGTPVVGPVLRGTQFDPTVPFKMLFTLHRGLFVWTPLTLFATAGFVLLLRRDRRHRAFLSALGISTVALVAVHSLWGKQWDGGSSFSQRFLTALFPFFLVGAAELVRRFRAGALVLLALCTGWSLWIGLVQYNGYYHESAHDSVVQIVENYSGPYRQPPPHDSIGNFGHELGQRITHRWRVYVNLVS